MQGFWQRLHRLSLDGLGIGVSADEIGTSGEAAILADLPRGSVVFDVGASRGTYARLAHDAGASVHAFEPEPAAFRELRRMDGLCLHPYGLSDSDADLPLFEPVAGSPMASFYQRRVLNQPFDEVSKVHVRRLDEVCSEEGIDHIDLLKLDVEGHEAAVLRGARRMLDEGRIAAVQFEFGGAAIDSRTFLRDLIDLLPGFDLHRIVRDGLVPVSYDERWEIFTTTNFLARRSGSLR
jgi:FkbM family methyltransferase